MLTLFGAAEAVPLPSKILTRIPFAAQRSKLRSHTILLHDPVAQAWLPNLHYSKTHCLADALSFSRSASLRASV